MGVTGYVWCLFRDPILYAQLDVAMNNDGTSNTPGVSFLGVIKTLEETWFFLGVCSKVEALPLLSSKGEKDE